MKPLIEEIQEVVSKRGYRLTDVDFTKGGRMVIGITENKKAPGKEPKQLKLDL